MRRSKGKGFNLEWEIRDRNRAAGQIVGCRIRPAEFPIQVQPQYIITIWHDGWFMDTQDWAF